MNKSNVFNMCLFSVVCIVILLFSSFIFNKSEKDKFWISNSNINTINKTRYAVIFSEKRQQTVARLEKDLGIKLERWPAVFTSSCPLNENYSSNIKKKCKTCRGLTIAHKEIWDDFIHSDANYIVIFEDDAEIESIYAIPKISEKLNNLTADITYLGHCFDTLCNHAYVLNKKAAKALYEKVKTCGQALDEQIETIIKNGTITADYVQNISGRKHWTQGLIYQTGSSTVDGSMQSYEGEIKVQINNFN